VAAPFDIVDDPLGIERLSKTIPEASREEPEKAPLRLPGDAARDIGQILPRRERDRWLRVSRGGVRSGKEPATACYRGSIPSTS
jgi:hypothetical protein